MEEEEYDIDYLEEKPICTPHSAISCGFCADVGFVACRWRTQTDIEHVEEEFTDMHLIVITCGFSTDVDTECAECEPV